MENWITDIIEQYGYIGIFLLIAAENIFPPIPSEIILTFGGFMTISTNLTVFGAVTSSTIGSVVGAVILYFIGTRLDMDKMEEIIDKWGGLLRLGRKDIHRANKWFQKHGGWTVFFCRFIPLIRSLISIPAGMSRMNFGLFLLLTSLGTLIWNTVLVNLGAKVGDSWKSIVGYMGVYSNVVYAVLGIGLVIFIVIFIKKRKE
ncbi:DedA family protein [Pseudalkalibacillus caeni]|uniref:DedA family protein n=1 Tax=Exobacillus caeni TaxID=2574798 RepID=A0A5R9EYD6_9BACL|nr:DedA family protein [Pseudalkalibacillus caeni]TLS36157.1 DedA family protein [Pseudalkalibacillus caeni]